MLGHKFIPSRSGGIDVAVEELAIRMVRDGHQVTCFNRRGFIVDGRRLYEEKSEEYKGIRLKTVFTIEKKGLAAVTSSFSASLRSAFGPYDVVHFHSEGPCFFMWIPKLFRKRCIATIHGIDWQRAKWTGSFGSTFIRWGEKAAVRRADEIIVLSKNMQNYFLETYGKTTMYIPNGVNRPEFREAKEITEKLGLHRDDYILFLGRIVPEKGLKYLIEAFKQVHTDKKLVIAGNDSDTQNYLAELQEMAADDERILFSGFAWRPLVEELFSNAYLYCLPSDLEGMPLSLLEAMSYGNCCVVSDIAECVEVVQDKAVVFQKGNVDDLRNNLQMLVDDECLVNNYKLKSSDYVCEKYNWEDVEKSTLDLYVK